MQNAIILRIVIILQPNDPHLNQIENFQNTWSPMAENFAWLFAPLFMYIFYITVKIPMTYSSLEKFFFKFWVACAWCSMFICMCICVSVPLIFNEIFSAKRLEKSEKNRICFSTREKNNNNTNDNEIAFLFNLNGYLLLPCIFLPFSIWSNAHRWVIT